MLVKFKVPPAQWEGQFAKLGIAHTNTAKKYESFSQALFDAGAMANEINFPVEVSANGRSYIVYPDGLKKALGK